MYRALISEDDPTQVSWLRSLWDDSVFPNIGVSFQYDVASSISELSTKIKNRPHLALIDNNYGTDENAGLRFISEHRHQYPDVIFWLVTNFDFETKVLGTSYPGPDLIVQKSFIQESGYSKFLANEFKRLLKRTSVSRVSIAMNAIDKTEIEKRVPKEELRSLIEQCLFEETPKIQSSEFEVTLKPLTGGFSGSLVFKQIIDEGPEVSIPDTVVKIDTKLRVNEELYAFNKSVRWQLPHNRRVDLIGNGETTDSAAICYGFVLGGNEQTLTATEALQSERVTQGRAAVKSVIDNLFLSKGGWYSETPNDGSDFRSYFSALSEFSVRKDNRRDNGLKQFLEEYSESIGCDLKKDQSGYLIDNKFKIFDVRKVIFSQKKIGNIRTCLCHGDLNSNNVFVNSKTKALGTIDFSDSGSNHIARDFVSFESSVRAESTHNKSVELEFDKLVEIEKLTLNEFENNSRDGRSDYPEYIELIQKVRMSFCKTFGNDYFAQYAAALLMHTWKLFGIDAFAFEAKRRMIALMVAAGEILEKR